MKCRNVGPRVFSPPLSLSLSKQEGSLSPLHHAVLGGKVDVVKYLLSFPQVDPNVGEGVRTVVNARETPRPTPHVSCRWAPRRCTMPRVAA